MAQLNTGRLKNIIDIGFVTGVEGTKRRCNKERYFHLFQVELNETGYSLHVQMHAVVHTHTASVTAMFRS